MKIKALILVTLLSALPACALTTSEVSSVDFMRANGYSDAIVDAVQASKAAANGEQYVSFEEQKYGNSNVFVKWIRKFFTYIDPALDQKPVLKHDTKMTPSVYDL